MKGGMREGMGEVESKVVAVMRLVEFNSIAWLIVPNVGISQLHRA